ncbi:conserved hypothetical protein [Synechococcus sp. PCC 7335]|uniref:DUF1257 domain-containing protein n=1 Tax=Synechococcus sp. (strain ATCC 29403 / PCC 7335) TaxID=91464 RepID=UPI00017EE0C8|nr:DUF1257 domain-containing protein [Synechococcus sp. PCC 7335]EDX87716.1 conserved hypothetical protein [Synechococcus sp. PCC 7335]
MSHFSQIKTKLRNLSSLQLALSDAGVRWQAGPKAVRGYQGDTQTAEIVIEQDNGYDVGFKQNSQTGNYELIADLQYWKQPLSVQGFLNKVTQRYAYHTVLNESVDQGFQVSEQATNEDGSIRLVLQRWGA